MHRAIADAVDGTLEELHRVARERAGLVGQNGVHHPELLVEV